MWSRNPQKALWLLRAHRVWNFAKSQSINLTGEGQQDEKQWNKTFGDRISPFTPFLFTPFSPSRTPPHASTIFTKGYFAKSAHIALSVIKMNCWCASVQPHKCAKSDGILPVCERMPSVRRMCLSLMYSHRVQCWQGGATLNQSLAWQVSNTVGRQCKSWHHPVAKTRFTRKPRKINHSTLILFLTGSVFNSALSCPSEEISDTLCNQPVAGACQFPLYHNVLCY